MKNYDIPWAVFNSMEFNQDDWSTSRNGLVFRKLVLELVFYFYEDEALKSREAMIKIVDEYADMVGPKLRWTTNPDTGSWKALKNGYRSYLTLDEWLMKAGRGVWEFEYHGGQKATEASDFEISGLGAGLALADKGFSQFYCYFPYNYFKRAVEMADLGLRWAGMLKPFHGYGGLAWANSHGLLIDDHIASIILDSYYSCMYPGININRFSTDSNMLTKEIKGVDWLTFLSDHFIEKLGGSDSIKTRLSTNDGLVYRPYQGGAMIMIGQSVRGGGGEGSAWSNNWDDPQFEPYRQVASIVEPVRKKDHVGYFNPREGLVLEHGCKYLDPDQLRAWLARFSPKDERVEEK